MPNDADQHEWLVTNGIGGYASGTWTGEVTRRYHGLLIAAVDPPVGRMLLATRLNEHVDGQPPQVEAFALDGQMPVWTLSWADARVEKRLWMAREANTAYVRYRLAEDSRPITLTARLMTTARDHHGIGLRVPPADVRLLAADRAEVRCGKAAPRLTVRVEGGTVEAMPISSPRVRYPLAVEAERGLEFMDEADEPVLVTMTLMPGSSATISLSAEASIPSSDDALAAQRDHERRLVAAAPPAVQGDAVAERLTLAADAFIARRPLPDGERGHTIIAGYPWFGDWGRDTMISLRGLALCTGRVDVATSILRTYARFVDRGMLPNRFPDSGADPEYNTGDATLWFLEAIRATLAATGGRELARTLFPVMRDILDWHRRGTRFGIGVDPADGLLRVGQPDVQLTWMDVKIGDWVVTPRTGKPVEINALWYNALRITAELAALLGEPDAGWTQQAERVRHSFARYWNSAEGYLFDVLDGPDGDDATIRPNATLAVSLTDDLLPLEQRRAVLERAARDLLTPYGLRSLSPADARYRGLFMGGPEARDSIYHNGTVWGWLIGPFVEAHLRVHGDRAAARAFLQPLADHLAEHTLGSLSEVFDGDAPHAARGCFAQAWTVAEVLRAWLLTAPEG